MHKSGFGDARRGGSGPKRDLLRGKKKESEVKKRGEFRRKRQKTVQVKPQTVQVKLQTVQVFGQTVQVKLQTVQVFGQTVQVKLQTVQGPPIIIINLFIYIYIER